MSCGLACAVPGAVRDIRACGIPATSTRLSGPRRFRCTISLMAFRDNLAKLRSLAGEKGYELEKAPISGAWFLIEEVTGQLAVSDRDTTAFSVDRAIAFLKRVPERP
jgi:hypothetical protein